MSGTKLAKCIHCGEPAMFVTVTASMPVVYDLDDEGTIHWDWDWAEASGPIEYCCDGCGFTTRKKTADEVVQPMD